MLNLRDPGLLKQKAYLDGAWCDADSGKTIIVTNPATGAVIGSVPEMGELETRRAIDAANLAWKTATAKHLSYNNFRFQCARFGGGHLSNLRVQIQHPKSL